jgi:hypothetical protein
VCRGGAVNEGWIPAWRKLLDPDHWMAPTKVSPAGRRDAWLDLCQMATHKPREVRGEAIEVGEIIVSLRTLAKRWGWSKSRTERFVIELEARAAIGTVRGTPFGTVYRIVNYEVYAIPENSQRDTLRDSERDRSGTGAGQEQPLNHLTITETARASQLPKTWAPTAEHIERARTLGLDLLAEVEKFRAHAEEHNRKAIVWNGAFTRWLINAAQYAKRNGQPARSAGRGYRDPSADTDWEAEAARINSRG